MHCENPSSVNRVYFIAIEFDLWQRVHQNIFVHFSRTENQFNNQK